VHRPGIAFQELPPIDVVLVSHNHYDHLDLETLQKLEMKFHPVFITALGNALFLKARGLKNVVELDWWESHSVLDTEFTLTPAQHFSSRSMRDRDQSLWGGFYIKTLDYKIFFAADSGYCPCFKEIAERLGNPDLSFIPIGAYEPRWFMRTVHMNPDDAVLAHRDLGSQQSVGIHFGCFKLTAESIDAPIADLTKALAKYEVEAKKFYAPEFGRIYTL
jgi:L-ascorbate metabolism protein UlaG (beta-lactamase superfamily)